VASAHAALTSALDAARVDSAYAASLEAVASGYAAQAAREHVRNDILTDSVNVLRGRYQATAKVAPVDCAPVVAAANALIATDDSTITSLRAELSFERAARDTYHAAADSAQAALARLTGPIARVDDAAQALAQSTHEPFWARVTPKRQITAGGGLDLTGRPVAAVIVGLGWAF
jgi:hypothetical protein